MGYAWNAGSLVCAAPKHALALALQPRVSVFVLNLARVCARGGGAGYVTLMHPHRHGCLGFNDALLCCLCVFTVHANNALDSRP